MKYWYRVRSFTAAAGNSASVNKAYAITKLPPSGTLNPRLSDAGPNYLTIEWDAPQGGATQVEIQFRKNIDDDYSILATVAANAETYTATGLTAQDFDRLRIVAKNSVIVASASPPLGTSPGGPFTYNFQNGHIHVDFPSDILKSSFELADLDLTNLYSGIQIDRSKINPMGGTGAHDLDIAAPGYTNFVPPDGNYEARIDGTRLLTTSNASGTDLSGGFYVLTGDLNNDRRINTEDFNYIAGGLGLDPSVDQLGDINNDLHIDLDDRDLLASKFGTFLRPHPTNPGEVAATAHEGQGISLVWAADGDTTIEKYGIFRSEDGVNFTKLTDVNPNPRTYVDNDTVDGMKYWYRVRAFKTNIGYYASYNKSDATTVLWGPSDLRAEELTGSSTVLTWKDNAQSETGFKVYRSVNGGAFDLLQTLAGQHSGDSRLSYLVKNLNPGTNYSFRVEAYTASAVSAPSMPCTIRTPAKNETLTIRGVTAAWEGDTIELLASGGTDSDLSTSLTYTWTVQRNGKPFTTGSGPNLSLKFGDDGQYKATVVVLGGIKAMTAEHTIHVTNAAPQVTQLVGPSNGATGKSLTYLVTARDAGGIDDPITYLWSVKKNGVEFSLPSSVQTSLSSLTFVPTTVGEYVASVLVADDDGATSSKSFKTIITATGPSGSDHVISPRRRVHQSGRI